MQSLANKHAFVTGGGTGIGLAITKSLVDAGARVTIASRNRERLEEVAAEMDKVTAVALDVADEAQVQQVFGDAGTVDILINNAGIAVTAPLAAMEREQWQRVLDVNLTGAYLCTRAALAGMPNDSRIINIASTAGLKGFAYAGAYVASKHGMVGLTKSLAVELAPTGTTVNCVCPGFVDTDMVSNAVKVIKARTGRSDDEALAELMRHNPQQRLIEPAEVAAAVMWLCQDEARSVTGQAIAITGGESI